MKTAVAERQMVPEVKVDWEKIQATNQETEKQEQPKEQEQEKDPYWKDYNEFLVNLA